MRGLRCHIGEGVDPSRAEVHRWIFGRLRNADDVQYNVLLRTRLQAAKDLEACYQLPLEIGRDIAVVCHGAQPREFTEQFAGKSGLGVTQAVAAKGRVTGEHFSIVIHANNVTSVCQP